MRPTLSTAPALTRRSLLAAGGVLALSGCVARVADPGPAIRMPTMTDGAFVMDDGARLPYRAWLPLDMPADGPWAVVLALHGFNDSRDAWEIPAPDFTAAGIAVFAPDLRGFGAAPERGLWAGREALVSDADAMLRLLRRRFPHSRLFVMGESMGAALALLMATAPATPHVAGYVLVSPAVWGRAEMNLILRTALWLAVHTVPGMALTGSVAHVVASNNRAALIRLYYDALTIHRTRMDTLEGLVNLMDAALAASGKRLRAPSLFLYGGKDELVPKQATAASWRAVERASPRRARLAYYPGDYHLMLRDKARIVPIDDILAWMRNPAAPLPSGAGKAARAWLSAQT